MTDRMTSEGPATGPRSRCACALLAVAAAVAAGGSLFVLNSTAADPAGLFVVFRPDHTFAVSLASGATVGTTSGAPSVVAAGTYQLFVDDTSDTDSLFDLAGPGVKLVTDMTHGEDSTASFVETFQPSSTYTYRDDNHPNVTWTFVTDAGSSSSAGGSTTSTGAPSGVKSAKPASSSDIVGSAILPFRGTLAAAVSAAGKPSLTYKGQIVQKLTSGRYTVAVIDRSRKGGFTLQRTSKRPISVTGPAFVGKRAETLSITQGQWLFFTGGLVPSTPFRSQPDASAQPKLGGVRVSGGSVVTIATRRNAPYSGCADAWGCGSFFQLRGGFLLLKAVHPKWRVRYGEQVEDQGERSRAQRDREPRHTAAVRPAQRAPPARPALRLRSCAVWCLLGAAGRQGDPLAV